MPPPNGRSGGKNKKDNAMLENLRAACPPHKRKDLDKLYKQLNGDEVKINEKIQEWWEEPEPTEEEWADVKKTTLPKKKQALQTGRGGGRGQSTGRGRGGRGSGGREAGGRGGRGDRERGGRSGEGRGRGGRGDKQPFAKQEQQQEEQQPEKKEEIPAAPAVPAVPAAPPAGVPALKGAWGARAAAAAVVVSPPPPAPAAVPVTPTAASVQEIPQKASQPKQEYVAKPPEENPLEVGIVTQNDPMPSGRAAVESKPIRTTAAPSGNVWATKGSAHLIRAEKPKPPAPAPVPVQAPVAPPPAISQPSPIQHVHEPEPSPPAPPMPEPSLESGLPAGAWGSAPPPPAPEPEPAAPIEMAPASPAVSKQLAPSIPEPVQVSPEKPSASPPKSPAAPSNVLNMGHWEAGDADDQGLDFGFGFGDNNDEKPGASPADDPSGKSNSAATAVSPARPPPGLSLGGMPPMPESAVMVHELENKMESATLKEKSQEKPITSSLPSQPVSEKPQPPAPAPVLPSATAGATQQNYNQYGMPGMYPNYGAAGNAFVGMTPAGPVLAAGGPGKPQAPGLSQPNPPQQGLYLSQPPNAPSSGNISSDSNANDSANANVNANGNATAPNAGIPPGVPSAIPYPNPALHYGQPQFYMGQPQGFYNNYGYGQVNSGIAQQGFPYPHQQALGQNQGYGHHFDDHGQQSNTHHSGGSGYQKNNGGGYRGQRNHHGNNQYQNQYNPQPHQGYGQPQYGYGMGHHGEHFNPRGGYDPYSMPQGNTNFTPGGFQDEDHQKGKKGGRGQFQQGPPHQQIGGQQGFGLQGQGSESNPPAGSGWSNPGGGLYPNWQQGT